MNLHPRHSAGPLRRAFAALFAQARHHRATCSSLAAFLAAAGFIALAAAPASASITHELQPAASFPFEGTTSSPFGIAIDQSEHLAYVVNTGNGTISKFGTSGDKVDFSALDHNALFAASCASTSLCALVGSDGRIFTSTNPFSASIEPPAAPPVRGPRTVLHLESYPLSQTGHRRVRARFRFYSPTSVRGFECKRDRGPYRRCHSPLRYWVASGRHTLRVRAIGPTGLRGPAAVKHFRVNRPRAPAS